MCNFIVKIISQFQVLLAYKRCQKLNFLLLITKNCYQKNKTTLKKWLFYLTVFLQNTKRALFIIYIKMSFVGYKGVFNYLLPSAIYIGVVSVLRCMHIEIGSI